MFRTEKAFDRTGTLRYTNHYVEARRGDGSIMSSASTAVVQQRKIDYANGDEVRMNELAEKKSTYPKKYAVVPGQRDPQASCSRADDAVAGWVPSGEERIGGYRTIRMVHAGGQRTMTAWYALDAGCALLQFRFEHETGVTV